MSVVVNSEYLASLFPEGYLQSGVVEHHAPFGIFINVGHPIVRGLVEIVEFLDEGIMSQDLFPKVGETITGVILDFTKHNNQIRLSMKPSKLKNAIK